MSVVFDKEFTGCLPMYGPDACRQVDAWLELVAAGAFACGFRPVRTPVLFKPDPTDNPLMSVGTGVNNLTLQTTRKKAHDYIARQVIKSYRDLPLTIYELVPAYEMKDGVLTMDWRFEFRSYFSGNGQEGVLRLWEKVRPVENGSTVDISISCQEADVSYTDRENFAKVALCETTIWPSLTDIFNFKKIFT